MRTRQPPEMYAYKDHKKKIDKGHKLDRNGNRVQFRLSYEEWLSVWGDKFPLRGRGLGRYVMSRFNDTGHYELGNVFVQPWVDNIRQGNTGRSNPSRNANVKAAWQRRKAEGWVMSGEQRHKISARLSGSKNVKNSEHMKRYWDKRKAQLCEYTP